jgi:hypothetical protein
MGVIRCVDKTYHEVFSKSIEFEEKCSHVVQESSSRLAREKARRIYGPCYSSRLCTMAIIMAPLLLRYRVVYFPLANIIIHGSVFVIQSISACTISVFEKRIPWIAWGLKRRGLYPLISRGVDAAALYPLSFLEG